VTGQQLGNVQIYKYSEGPADALPVCLTSPTVAILGSGDFARSLALRLVASGVRVVVGSRCVNRIPSGLFPDAVELRNQEGAVSQAVCLVFMALFPEHYCSLLGLQSALAGKVLVDVSNAAEMNIHGLSNAERLAELFPNSLVVKGFNTVSTWELQTGAHDGSRQVLICSNSTEGKKKVVQLARQMGFHPVDMGGLSAAREIEVAPLRLLPSWSGPVVVTFLLFLFFYGYGVLLGILLPFLAQGHNAFYRLALDLVNESLPAVALVTLALVYFPGLFAAWLQLWSGTKYRRFPSWLDNWLQRRKQLGLLSFLGAALHGVYSLCLPLRRISLHRIVNTEPWDELGVWRSELYLSCGVLGLGVLSLLAVTSLPSVGNTLNWREFTFVQSGLGYIALTLSIMHTLFFGWDFAFHIEAYPFYMPPSYLLAVVLPCIVLVCRCFLLLPCIFTRLTRIRRGWESKQHPCSWCN
uniref:Metalloreductase STEAP3-like n=1 Tax=Sinocyclocheilus rhinocerous TaxID=307959 RepID=A0A673HVI6_9TELE